MQNFTESEILVSFMGTLFNPIVADLSRITVNENVQFSWKLLSYKNRREFLSANSHISDTPIQDFFVVSESPIPVLDSNRHCWIVQCDAGSEYLVTFKIPENSWSWVNGAEPNKLN